MATTASIRLLMYHPVLYAPCLALFKEEQAMKHYEGPFPGWLEQRPPGPLPLETVAHLIRQAAAILQSAHNQGVAHKNITLDSFLVRATDEQPHFLDLLITGFGQPQGSP